ncbi:hypothetical protein C8R48DRAFT_710816 [Suillus tomentosus]|nr:hypothetical protein C8R48DRAFT_710816 [Suillus tomentosus]
MSKSGGLLAASPALRVVQCSSAHGYRLPAKLLCRLRGIHPFTWLTPRSPKKMGGSGTSLDVMAWSEY